MEPEFVLSLRGLGATFAAKGMHEAAIETFRKAVESSGESAYHLGGLGWAYGVAGRRARYIAQAKLW